MPYLGHRPPDLHALEVSTPEPEMQDGPAAQLHLRARRTVLRCVRRPGDGDLMLEILGLADAPEPPTMPTTSRSDDQKLPHRVHVPHAGAADHGEPDEL